MPIVRHRQNRDDADGCLPLFLRVQGVPDAAPAESWRLLRILFLRVRAVPADSGGWGFWSAVLLTGVAVPSLPKLAVSALRGNTFWRHLKKGSSLHAKNAVRSRYANSRSLKASQPACEHGVLSKRGMRPPLCAPTVVLRQEPIDGASSKGQRPGASERHRHPRTGAAVASARLR